MLVACLGWGSLVWDPRGLPVRGQWLTDGPLVPIEFARQSEDGRISLVIVPERFPQVRSLWALLSVTALNEAREALRNREGIPREKAWEDIGHWRGGRGKTRVEQRIGRWARTLGLAAVVWTNLPAKFNGKKGKIPSGEEVLTYLSGLTGEERNNAERYIRMAPRQIDTNYRRLIEERLGWTATGPV